MHPLWNDTDAAELGAEAEAAGAPAPLAQRLYSARLIGQDPELALHGGGTVSVKITDADGASQLHITTPDAAGGGALHLPVLGLAPLQAAKNAPTMASDAQMQALIEARNAALSRADNGKDKDQPAPLLDAFMHACLPHGFVDHTHPAAILALANQPDMAAQVARILGGRVGFVPYTPPGHGLALACLRAVEAQPELIGLWLEQHGLVTFGDSARESHARLIECVTLAEDHLRSHGAELAAPEADDLTPPDDLAMHLTETLATRGALGKRPYAAFRSSASIRRWLARDDLVGLTRRGPVTPEQVGVLRPFGMIIADDAGEVAIDLALRDHEQDYREWFDRNNQFPEAVETMRDPLPRAVLVPGLGVYGLGADQATARIAADLLEQTARIVNSAEDYGRFTPVSGPELLAVEYAITG